MQSIDISTLGRRIRARREALKLTQGQLAAKAGITQPSLSDIESDKTKEITARTLGSLCRALGLVWEYVLYGVDDMAAEDAQNQAELLAIYRALPTRQAKDSILAAARAVLAAVRPDDPPPIGPSQEAEAEAAFNRVSIPPKIVKRPTRRKSA